VIDFDHEIASKRNLTIVSAITALDPTNGQSALLVMHESIHNETSNRSIFLEFQFRRFGIMIDSNLIGVVEHKK
jgi:hypothetical protein